MLFISLSTEISLLLPVFDILRGIFSWVFQVSIVTAELSNQKALPPLLFLPVCSAEAAKQRSEKH